MRQDWRMFKLTRLWGLTVSEEEFTPQEIPPERRNKDSHFADDIQLKAFFHPSVKYQLIEAYGLNSYLETEDGLLFEFDFSNRRYLISWLLSFGGNVKVLGPKDLAEDIQAAAKDILVRYN